MDKFERHELYPLYEAVCMQENGQYAEGLVQLLRGRNAAFRNNDQNTVSLCNYLGFQLFIRNMYLEQWKPQKLQPEQIYECLLQICAEAEVEDDDPQALAAFWLGKLLIEYGGKLETGISWVEKSLDLANSNFLKLSVILLLATQYLRADNISQAIEFCEKLKHIALATESQEYVFYALAHLARIQCIDGNFGEARRALVNLKIVADQFADDKFFSGIVKAVEYVICTLSYNPSAAAEPRKAALQLLNQYVEEFKADLSNLFFSGVKMPCFERHHHVATFWSICGHKEDISDSSHEDVVWETGVKMTNLQNFVEQHLKNNELEEAEACTAEMLQLALSSECVIYLRHTVLIYISEIIAQYHTHEGKLDEEGLEIIESFFHGWFPSNLPMIEAVLKRGFLSFFYLKAQKFDSAVARLQECLEMFLREVDRNFESYSTGRIFYLEKVHYLFLWLEDTLLKLEPSQIKRSLLWTEKRRARDLLYQIDSRFNSHAYVKDMASFDFIEDVAWSEIKSVCEIAGHDTAFLIYSDLPNFLCSYFLHVNEEPCYFAHTQSQQFVCPREPKVITRHILEDAFKCLVQPWKQKLESLSINKIVIIPSKQVANVPFAALCDPQKDENASFLIQSYAVAYAPSLRLYKYCELRRRELTNLKATSKLSALVVGNPMTKLDDLPDAEKEADYVAAKLAEAGYDPVHLLKREAATSDKVLEHFSSCDWVHIASHGYGGLQEPPYAGMFLAPHNDKNSSSSFDQECMASRCMGDNIERSITSYLQPLRLLEHCQEDGVQDYEGSITTDLIEGEKVVMVRIVVLSGCTTGLGKACAEGVLGLCRSLHMIGVPNVLASLWNVNDHSTQVLMEKFYGYLKDGLDTTYSLQEAMKFMVQEEDKFGHPKFAINEWAPFVLSGSSLALQDSFSLQGR